MQRAVIRTSVAAVLILGLAACTTGPQVYKDYEGDYLGSTTGAPPSLLEFTVSGNNLSGTGMLKTDISILYGNSGNESDLVITGTRDGAEITSMSATVSFNYNRTPNDTVATWVIYTGEMRFTGEFNKTGGVQGSYGGEASAGGHEIPLGGGWIAVKQDAAAGIIKP